MRTHDNFTPTQDLVLETLIARHRLGEELWTFDRAHRKTISELEIMGLVHSMNGIVENTVRARLSEDAKKRFMKNNYIPPILQK